MEHSPDVGGPAPSRARGWAARSVLVVDDEPGVRELLSRWLVQGGYEVSSACDAVEAISLMDRSPSAVALCDIRMPGHDGLWLADRIRRGYPDTAVIMATGIQDVGPAVESLRCGVVDYLTKPLDRFRVREAVCRGMQYHRSACESRRWRDALEADLRARQRRLAEAIAALPIESDEGVDALLSMLTINQRPAYEHAYRVAALAVSVARAVGLSEPEVTVVEQGALLHDLGKLALPDALLGKPAPLTSDERALVQLHPALGSDLIGRIPYLAAAAAVVRDAHERPDGLGFPLGSRGDDVWIGARIVAVADAYDTMTRPRVFRDAISEAEAVDEIERGSGTQFDPRAVEAFRTVLAGW
jgi:response regulator RpfG family c-di-GMP phosphodiesterase